jgi:hypothetical protein
MGHYVRYGGPHPPVNALAGAFACRALLRLKPSRISESMRYTVRYGGPHPSVNALRARLPGEDVAAGKAPPVYSLSGGLCGAVKESSGVH